MNEDLIITCRTTCGCGNELVPYTKQTETTHYLLTCKPFSDKYDHPLLIAIDKNSPVFIKAQKYDWIMPWLRDNLTEEQLNLLSVLTDPLSRRILKYLVSEKKE